MQADPPWARAAFCGVAAIDPEYRAGLLHELGCQNGDMAGAATDVDDAHSWQNARILQVLRRCRSQCRRLIDQTIATTHGELRNLFPPLTFKAQSCIMRLRCLTS